MTNIRKKRCLHNSFSIQWKFIMMSAIKNTIKATIYSFGYFCDFGGPNSYQGLKKYPRSHVPFVQSTGTKQKPYSLIKSQCTIRMMLKHFVKKKCIQVTACVLYILSLIIEMFQSSKNYVVPSLMSWTLKWFWKIAIVMWQLKYFGRRMAFVIMKIK